MNLQSGQNIPLQQSTIRLNHVNDKLKIIRAFPVTILVVGNEISLADRKCT